jgi:adenosylcobinamide-GDP ribazoletransferase
MIKLFWATLSFLSRLPVPDRWSQGLEIDRYVPELSRWSGRCWEG